MAKALWGFLTVVMKHEILLCKLRRFLSVPYSIFGDERTADTEVTSGLENKRTNNTTYKLYFHVCRWKYQIPGNLYTFARGNPLLKMT